jgi:hypothetical protein
VTLAVSGNTWLEVIVTLSIVVPLTITGALTWFFLRGARNDPDEQRRRRLDEQRREATRQHDR